MIIKNLLMKKLLFLFLLTGTLSAHADDSTYAYLTFTKGDGTMQSVSVSSLKLIVQGSTLTAVNDDGTVAFALSDLSKMAFSSTAMAVEGVAVQASEEPVYVYSVGGVMVGRFASVAVVKEKIGKGIYVVKSGDNTFKLIVP